MDILGIIVVVFEKVEYIIIIFIIGFNVGSYVENWLFGCFYVKIGCEYGVIFFGQVWNFIVFVFVILMVLVDYVVGDC